MVITIPEPVISAFWAMCATGLLAIAGILVGIKNRHIPLTWGAKKMQTTECISSVEFDEKLRVHCSKRQQTLDAKLEMIFAAQNRFTSVMDALSIETTAIGKGLAKLEGRIEGLFSGDHK